jgi:peptidoglycan/xylan/chitin deacetylase (PgdA/CDA1 family)
VFDICLIPVLSGRDPIFAFLLLHASLGYSQTTTPEKKEVVCFIYHRFGDGRYPTTNTPVKDFAAHLDYLEKNKFRIVTFSEAIDYLKSDEPSRKTACITIDDGYKSFFKNGLPLLKKHHMPATLFINTKTVGGADMMSWAELKDAMNSQMEIGNHTHSHAFFLNENAATRYETFRQEIELSQSMIKENLQVTPVVFTFPYGEFDPKMKTIVQQLGFKGAAAQNSGVIHEGADLFMCPRFPMSESYSPKEKFVEIAAMKALKIIRQSPDSFVAPDRQPLLTLTIDNTGLRLNQLRCFVQGGTGTLKTIKQEGRETTVTIRANQPLGKRRVLYTLTAPDKEGKWHWFSHVWITPSKKEE